MDTPTGGSRSKIGEQPEQDAQFLYLVGRQIAAARVRINITQEELASQTNLSRSFIGHLELGKRNAALLTLKKIASVLGVRVTELVDVEDRLLPKRKAPRR